MHPRHLVYALLAILTFVSPATADVIGYQAVTLVSSANDSDLINPWGLSTSAASPFWVGANGSGLSLIYDSNGVRNPNLAVTIPGNGSVTGVTFNGGVGFNGDLFLFASEDGTISGWRGALGSNAEVLQTADPSNSYKGLDVELIGSNRYGLFADFASATIDVLKGTPGAPNLTGNFTDPNLPAGYAPFNVQVLNGFVYVTYALRDPQTGDDMAGA